MLGFRRPRVKMNIKECLLFTDAQKSGEKSRCQNGKTSGFSDWSGNKLTSHPFSASSKCEKRKLHTLECLDHSDPLIRSSLKMLSSLKRPKGNELFSIRDRL